jgi:hypothetical protein
MTRTLLRLCFCDHTNHFAIERGANVSRLLGHTSIKITEKHYNPWVKSRQDALDADLKGGNGWLAELQADVKNNVVSLNRRKKAQMRVQKILQKPFTALGLLLKPYKTLAISTIFLEARVGIEPTYKGFADLSLTTWVPRPGMKYSESWASFQPGKPSPSQFV